MSYNPWAAIAPFDVVVAIRRLPSGRGWWVPEERMILIDDRQDAVGRRCTLAHELEHVLAGDSACGAGMEWFDRRQEHLADVRAARKLIPLEALVDANLWGRYPGELADELRVDDDILRVRIHDLTEQERALIDGRLEAQGGAA